MKKLMALMLLMIAILAGCGTSSDSEGSDKKELIMGTSADYPPFEYIDSAKSEEIIGFDIDLANALGEKLGYTIKVKDSDLSGLIPAIKAG